MRKNIGVKNLGRWITIKIRPIIYGVSIVLAVTIYGIVAAAIPASNLRTIRLVEVYAFTAVICLYSALLVSPLYSVFPTIPLRALAMKARQALGVSAFGFGVLHGSIAFFFLLGGFQGLGFLSSNYLLAMSLGASAALLLSLLALTSPRYFLQRLGARWKLLHRAVYLAGVLIIIHALMLGTHFADLSKTIPQIAFAALFFLLTLEAFRFDASYKTTHPTPRPHSIPFIIMTVLLALAALWFFFAAGTIQSLGIHAQHLLQRDAVSP